jgi:hypothetical protein
VDRITTKVKIYPFHDLDYVTRSLISASCLFQKISDLEFPISGVCCPVSGFSYLGL